jgi:hypothetical protein
MSSLLDSVRGFSMCARDMSHGSRASKQSQAQGKSGHLPQLQRVRGASQESRDAYEVTQSSCQP